MLRVQPVWAKKDDLQLQEESYSFLAPAQKMEDAAYPGKESFKVFRCIQKCTVFSQREVYRSTEDSGEVQSIGQSVTPVTLFKDQVTRHHHDGLKE